MIQKTEQKLKKKEKKKFHSIHQQNINQLLLLSPARSFGIPSLFVVVNVLMKILERFEAKRLKCVCECEKKEREII